MSSDDSISYQGPDRTFQPSIGANRSADRRAKYNTPQERSYADQTLLQNALALILIETKELTAALEIELDRYALPVTAVDQRLIEAQAVEWPEQLGAIPNRISYRFYKALGVRTSTSALYIRSRYEDGMRDVTGTDAVDILTIVGIIAAEAELVVQFLPLFMGDVNDTSEYRTLELFQDWTDSARLQLEDLRKIRAQAKKLTLSDAEISSVSPREARNAQATFKVKLNATNRELVETLSFIRRTWSDHAGTFYGRFLGPALRYRVTVASKTQPLIGVLANDMRLTNRALDNNLSVMQADQLRRNLLFDAKMREANDKIRRQDAYRNYIGQLTVKGRPLPVTAPGLVIRAVEPPEEIEHFTEEEVQFQAAKASSPVLTAANFTGKHGSLAGRDDGDAHSQYLLRTGDTVSGNLAMNTGVRVDGVDIDLHSHTGADGSTRVHGTSIIAGSLLPEVVNPTKPPAPTAMRLIEQRVKVIPPGVAMVEATVAFDGDIRYQYELQSIRLS